MYKYIYNLHLKNIPKKSFYHYFRAVSVLGFKKVMPFYFKLTKGNIENKLNDKKNKEQFIVSLTTFPKRINKVWLTIESILRQEVKPDKIILWLYKGEFENKEALPKNLLQQEGRGLEIRFCDENLKPHKKYYYTLKEHPNSNLITVDDDFIYPPNLIKNLIKANLKYPKSIICSMSREIKVEKGKFLPYNEWKRVEKNTLPSFKYLTMGGGGTLFPVKSLHHDVSNLDNMKSLAFHADDLWLKTMSLKANTKVVSLEGEYPRPFFQIDIENNSTLADSNLREGQNDIVFKKLIDFYKIPLSIFKD